MNKIKWHDIITDGAGNLDCVRLAGWVMLIIGIVKTFMNQDAQFFFITAVSTLGAGKASDAIIPKLPMVGGQ